MVGIGGILVAIFGVVWTCSAISIGAPPFFPLFGAVFVLVVIGMAVYNFYNAIARNRVSDFDITAGDEETDPIAQALGYAPGEYCPFSGTKVGTDFACCPKCGKDI
ncbi:MAG: zinc ribbon domain-containing protein [Firmicutes bacterium]|nr:zinc ribbon domain-containing protein [Bacillota bacterium]